eukprot:CAMPEP_0118942316 /NCGR_PEP_ID=MMETSP1169-20130426/35964_1 /TAXON_ID=36882 /ORGANISM="Pyramimonas obovata, Strain CCMP722" /LENGTH=163 /DNA_ID=CAMNT_0006887321 /DNA_START=23 /DNA_END=510 /DNA_ORIENTATION=-
MKGDCVITLRGPRQRRVCCGDPQDGRSAPVFRCVARNPSRSVSYFTLQAIQAGGSFYRLKLVYRSVKSYLSTNEDSTLTVTTDKLHPSTAFSLHFDEHGRMALYSRVSSAYVTCGTNWELVANAADLKNAELFQLDEHDPQPTSTPQKVPVRVNIRANNGKYL